MIINTFIKASEKLEKSSSLIREGIKHFTRLHDHFTFLKNLTALIRETRFCDRFVSNLMFDGNEYVDINEYSVSKQDCTSDLGTGSFKRD